MDTVVRDAYLASLSSRGATDEVIELTRSLDVEALATAVLMATDDQVRWGTEPT